MALLLEISSFTGRGAPIRWSPKTRSKKNVRISVCSLRDSEMVRWSYGEVKQRETAPFKGNAEEEDKRDYYGRHHLQRPDERSCWHRELQIDVVGRFHGRIFFQALWVDIVSVWQPMEKKTMLDRPWHPSSSMEEPQQIRRHLRVQA
ncbi:hypothetical protein AAHA92_22984 [Salvia divinorum]|uniref:Uncharacterized protein n=1 Tax=Salvia divinorum TaxID=28513 RepID=A0ABD1GQJ7_SALDI